MKNKLLTTAAFLMFAISVSAQWTKPTVTKFVEMAADGQTTQYLYNVDTKKFFVGHNEWNTRASIDDYGDPIRMSLDDEEMQYYDFGCYPSKYRTDINAWKSLSGKSWNDMWCDGVSGNDNYLGVKMWFVMKDGDYYKFSNDYFNQQYEFGPTEATLGASDYVAGTEGDTRLYLYYQHTVTVTKHFDDGDEDIDVDCFQGEFHDKWKFVSEEDYQAYVNALDTYNAAMELKKAIEDAEAEYKDIDLTAQKNVYNNTGSTIEELQTAKEEVAQVVLDYIKNLDVDPNNPVNYSSSIENGTFDVVNDFHGWLHDTAYSNGFGAGGNVDTCAEVWHGSFDVYQNVANLPEGVYKLVCNGFSRHADNISTDYNQWKAGGKSDCSLYLTSPSIGTFSVPVKLISEGGSWGYGIGGAGNHVTGTYVDQNGDEVQDDLYTPNYMTEANAYFHEGEGTRYRNEVFGAVADGEELRIGVINKTNDDWNVFDDFQLFYYGSKPESYQYWGNIMANQSSVNLDGSYYGQPDKDAYDAVVVALKGATTKEDVLNNVQALAKATENLELSKTNYKKFVDAYYEAIDWLENSQMTGDDVNKLSDYLQSSADDWNEGLVTWDFPHGVVNVFLDLENNALVGTLSAEEIAAETKYLQELKELAVKNGMEEGSDVTDLLVNPKFDGTFDGWTYKEGKLGNHNVECYYQVVDVYQVVNNVRPGVYAITVNAFERPAENGNYNGSEASKVFLFMNQFQTPVQNICMDAIADEDCIEEENCYTGSGTGAWPNDYYVEGYGWVPNSVDGAYYAFKSNRYEQTCYGLVGDDGVMKVGLTSNNQQCAWVLWANFRLTFMGKNVDALKSVIANYLEKADEISDEQFGTQEKTNLETAKQFATTAQSSDDLYDALFQLVDAYTEALASIDKYNEANQAMTDLYSAYEEYTDAAEDVRELALNTYETYAPGVTETYAYSNDELDEIIALVKDVIAKLKMPDVSDGSDDNPIDLTVLIENPSYDYETDDGWEGSTKSHSSFNRKDMNEYYYSTFDHYQTLKKLPAGTYELALNCFNRTPGNSAEEDRKIFEEGRKLEQMSAFVYAKVGETTFAEPFRLVSEGARAGSWDLSGGSNDVLSSLDGIHYFTPNDMTAAGAAFEETTVDDESGEEVPLSDELNYRVRVVFTLTTESDVTIGAKNTRGDTWAIWDNWTLTYFGKDSEKTDSGDATLVEAIESAKVMATEIYTIGGARIPTMQRGLNIVKMSDGSFRKVFVK